MKKKSRPAAPPRVSTARRAGAPGAKGRARIQEILAAAKSVLLEKDYTQFSLRNIAAAAGMRLANLQYYFPSKGAIIHALGDYVVQEYESRYRAHFAKLPNAPQPRFVAMLDFLIEDIHEPRTRRFFVQLWALLESSDRSGRGVLLNELYAHHIAGIAQHIGELNPKLSPGARRQRAAMISAMIDGMMLMLLDADALRNPGEPDLAAEMRRQLLRIATDA
jgi:AcrR family transcriptional regulator